MKLIDSCMSRREWLEEAACRASWVDPEWFFAGVEDSEWALSLCASCPVVGECRRWILAQDAASNLDQIWGICGGLTGAERQRIRRRELSSRDDSPLSAERVASLPICAGGCGRLLVQNWELPADSEVFARVRAYGMCSRCASRERRRRERERAASETASKEMA